MEMPIKDLIKRREYQREYRRRSTVKSRNNARAKERYDAGYKEKKKAYDAARRKCPKYRENRKSWFKNYKQQNWGKVRLREIKIRARALGLEFNLTEDDLILPTVCPVFGTPLVIGEGKQNNNSPSVDRIDNTKGYVKGNVVIVSLRANSLKREASLSELKTLVAFYEKLTSNNQETTNE
jgi:hypothetical protein